MPSYLWQALQARIIQLVEINEVKCIIFPSGPARSRATVGVRGLGACSVVIIASRNGAIVAHIGPNILGSDDPESFLRLAHSKMDDVVSLYNGNSALFQHGSQTYIIFATFGGHITSPEQVAVYRQRLEDIDVPNAVEYSYERPHRFRVGNDQPDGTLWVDGRGLVPRIYLEDQDITQNTQSVARAEEGSAPPGAITQVGNVYVRRVGQQLEEWNGRSWISISPGTRQQLQVIQYHHRVATAQRANDQREHRDNDDDEEDDDDDEEDDDDDEEDDDDEGEDDDDN